MHGPVALRPSFVQYREILIAFPGGGELSYDGPQFEGKSCGLINFLYFLPTLNETIRLLAVW